MNVKYSVRGIELDTYDVEDSPGLRALLESVDSEAYECGREAGQEDERDEQSRYDAEQLEGPLSDLEAVVTMLADLATDHAVATGTHLHAPSDHERAILAVRARLEAIAVTLRP